MVEAFGKELVKISEAKRPKITTSPQERKETFNKFLKTTAAISAGTGLGYGAGTAIDLLAQKALGKNWAAMVPNQKMRLLGAGLGLASAGAFAAREWVGHERKEAYK